MHDDAIKLTTELNDALQGAVSGNAHRKLGNDVFLVEWATFWTTTAKPFITDMSNAKRLLDVTANFCVNPEDPLLPSQMASCMVGPKGGEAAFAIRPGGDNDLVGSFDPVSFVVIGGKYIGYRVIVMPPLDWYSCITYNSGDCRKVAG